MWQTRVAIPVAILCLASGGRLAAIDPDISDSDVQRATRLGVAPEGERVRFHASYILPVNDGAVEQIEVVTEFRRLVLASEEQAVLGNWMYARGGYDSSGRTLKDALKEWRGKVAIRARIHFHPQHSYSVVPAIDVLVGEPPFLALDASRTPLTATASDGAAHLTGAVIETIFNAPSFHDRTLPVRVVLDDKEWSRREVDFARLD